MWDAFKSYSVNLGKHRVQAVGLNDDHIFIGTYYGSLLEYTRTKSGDDSGFKVELNQSVEKFSKKLIEKLSVIKDMETLLCLTDVGIELYDLKSLHYKSRLHNAKGAHFFMHYVSPDIIADPSGYTSGGSPDSIYLAVAVRKKLQLYVGNGDSFSEDPKEFTIPDRIQTMVFLSHIKICLGFSSGFAMLDTTDGSISELVLPSQVLTGSSTLSTSSLSSMAGYIGMSSKTSFKPIITSLRNNELLLACDNVGYFLGVRGQKTREKQLIWDNAPDDVAFCDPFVIAISNKQVEIRDIKSFSLVQIIKLEHTLRSIEGDKAPWIVGNNTIWRLEMIDFDEQIETLVSKEKFLEAIGLLEYLEHIGAESKSEEIQQVKRIQAMSLFRKGQYDDAVTIFLDLGTAPQSVISLYPSVITGCKLSGEKQTQRKAILDHTDVVKVDDKKQNEARGLAPMKEIGDDLASCGIQVTEQESMADGRRVETKQTKSGTNANETDDKIHDESGSDASLETRELSGEQLVKATSALIRFLTDRRHKISKAIFHQNTSAVSPILLATSSSSPRGSDLHRPGVSGSPRQFAERSLHSTKDSVLLNELASLGPKELQSLLEIVDTSLLRCYLLTNEKLVAYLVRVQNAINIEVGEQLLKERNKMKELVDLYHRREMHRNALELLQRLSKEQESSMQGVEPTIKYLQRLGQDHICLILEFSTWILKEDEDKGIEIFTADIPEVESLARDKVLAHLDKISKKLAIRYIKYVVFDLGDASPEFHTRLAQEWIEQAKSGDKEITQALVSFLDTSTQYQAERLLPRLPNDGIFEARALVLSRLGQHEQALIIYVRRMNDPGNAERYCTKVFDAKNPSTRSIFLILLKVLLHEQGPLIEPAVGLLARHGTKIDATEAMKVIPEALKIHDLYKFYEKQIREVQQVTNMNRIMKYLLQADQVQVQELLMYYRIRRVKVTDDRMCPQCAKRIGNSVFAVMPDGVVVHYGCKDQWSELNKQYYDSIM